MTELQKLAIKCRVNSFWRAALKGMSQPSSHITKICIVVLRPRGASRSRYWTCQMVLCSRISQTDDADFTRCVARVHRDACGGGVLGPAELPPDDLDAEYDGGTAEHHLPALRPSVLRRAAGVAGVVDGVSTAAVTITAGLHIRFPSIPACCVGAPGMLETGPAGDKP